MESLKKKLEDLSVENKGLYYKLFLVFALFFLTPVFGFLYFAFTYDLFRDSYLPLYFLAFLAMSFFGFVILRRLFDGLINLSNSIRRTVEEELKVAPPGAVTDELQGIVTSFQHLQRELRASLRCLEKKTSEILTLKELADLCYVTFNPEDLLYVTLERALKMVGADIGSVLVVDDVKRDHFVVEAAIGQEFVKKGDLVDFELSIAKYAVINKSPLLVEDIERDIRFGRPSRPHYATKSFICMPLKTAREVIGVITLSRRREEAVFTHEDVDVLTPLVSTAAFTYDNLRLLRENRERNELFQALAEVFEDLNSSLRGSELLHSLFRALRRIVPCGSLILLSREGEEPYRLRVVDALSFDRGAPERGAEFSARESIFERVIKRQGTLVVEGGGGPAGTEEQSFLSALNGKNAVIARVASEDRIIGLLVLVDVPLESAPETIKRVEVFAALFSLVLERERLLSMAAKSLQELETIRQVGDALSSSTFDMEKVLMYTMDMIQASLNVETGALLLRDGDELLYEVAFNIDIGLLRGIRLRMGQDIAGHAAARGVTIMAADAAGHPRYSPEFDALTGFRTRSIVCVPMISHGKVTGVIEVRNKRQGVFDENDIHLLQSLASAVTIALENARLYNETLAMAERERGIRKVFQKFVPKEVVEKIILGEAGEKLTIDESKTLTLLNIDLRGFSVFSRNLGPQRTVALVNHFFATMGEIVFRHGGIVDKYLGDGLLAVFGAPVSRPGDADNAVNAALEMRCSMGEVNDYLSERFETTLSMGISIHTGEVVVGNIGFEKKMDYTVIGDPVNFVFRLQGLCKAWPNGILVTEKTLQAVGQRDLELEEIGLFEAGRGLGEMKVYRVLGRKETPGKTEEDTKRGEL